MLTNVSQGNNSLRRDGACAVGLRAHAKHFQALSPTRYYLVDQISSAPEAAATDTALSRRRLTLQRTALTANLVGTVARAYSLWQHEIKSGQSKGSRSVRSKTGAATRSHAPDPSAMSTAGRRTSQTPTRSSVEVLTLSDSAAARLAARIHRGDIKPGERLTSERALATELGVSRPALREALQALQVAGLVQVRQKSGWYVAEHRTDASAHALLRWMQLQPVTDVVMVRRVLEPDAIRAVPAVKVSDLARECAEIASGMRRAVRDGDYARATALHSSFHLALVQYAPSRLARTLLASMIEASGTAQHEIFATPRANLETLKRHDWIVAALSEDDVELAAQHGAEHLQPAFAFRLEG